MKTVQQQTAKDHVTQATGSQLSLLKKAATILQSLSKF